MKKIFTYIMSALLCACSDPSPDELDALSNDQLPGIDQKLIEKASGLYNENLLVSSLNAIEEFHIKNDTGLVLNKPATAREFRKAESVFNCSLPDELVDLWSWHNGESTDKFIWYHRFLSINESIAEYKTLISTYNSAWKKNWIPVFEFQEEWYGVQCTQSPSIASPVIFYFIESSVDIPYANLTRHMAVLARSIESGALVWESGYWRDDIKKISTHHAKLNPGLTFPYYIGP